MTTSELLQILACPTCRKVLQPQGNPENPEGLCCQSCAVVYPVQNNIPVMLKEEAILLVDWQNGKRGK